MFSKFIPRIHRCNIKKRLQSKKKGPGKAENYNSKKKKAGGGEKKWIA